MTANTAEFGFSNAVGDHRHQMFRIDFQPQSNNLADPRTNRHSPVENDEETSGPCEGVGLKLNGVSK